MKKHKKNWKWLWIKLHQKNKDNRWYSNIKKLGKRNRLNLKKNWREKRKNIRRKLRKLRKNQKELRNLTTRWWREWWIIYRRCNKIIAVRFKRWKRWIKIWSRPSRKRKRRKNNLNLNLNPNPRKKKTIVGVLLCDCICMLTLLYFSLSKQGLQIKNFTIQ